MHGPLNVNRYWVIQFATRTCSQKKVNKIITMTNWINRPMLGNHN